jgi:hypothetical protein
MDKKISGNSRKQFSNFREVNVFPEKLEIFRDLNDSISALQFFPATVGRVKQGSFEHL